MILSKTLPEVTVTPLVMCGSLTTAQEAAAKDLWHADEPLHRMEQSGVELELQTYNDSLFQHAQVGTGEAAERARDILEHMHSLAMSYPSLKPTLQSYSTVVSAWAKSNDPIAADSMWSL
jgi:hypothetical protein